MNQDLQEPHSTLSSDPAVIVDQPGNVDDALSGSSQTFMCVTGGSSSDLSFYHNGVKLEGGVNDGTLTIASTTTDHTGMYQCIAENESGSDGTSWYLIVCDPSEW